MKNQFPLGIPKETNENLYDISKFKEKFNKGAHLVLFGGFEHFLNSYDDIKISGRGSGSDVIENYYHIGHDYGIAGEPCNCIQSVQPDPR